MGNTEVFHPTTRTGKALLWLWDMIDISENIERSEAWITSVGNGLQALLHTGVFLVLTIVFAALTWFFDLESTIVGLNSITSLVIPSLPKQVATFSTWIIVAFTLAPTVLELFTAGIAKQNVKIVQIGIIGFTLFDMITDIPRAYALALQMWPQIELMGWGLAHITFWAYFILWLGFATIGFELMTVLFGYALVCFTLKIFKGEGSIKLPRRSMSNRTSKASDDKIVIIGE
jgi:hypothetical protein